jgi:hypothetical protein
MVFLPRELALDFSSNQKFFHCGHHAGCPHLPKRPQLAIISLHGGALTVMGLNRSGDTIVNEFISGDGADDSSNDADRSLWEELGIHEPVYLDERLAPPVDRELLRRLVRRELSELAARAVTRMIVTFVSWRDAHAEVLLAELRGSDRPDA